MKLNLIYGKSGTGKSTFLYKKIKEEMLNDDSSKIYLIVPEQSNLTAERKLFDVIDRKSLINTEVLTFSRMAYRVFGEVGIEKKPLTKINRYMIIYNELIKLKSNLAFLGKSEKNIEIVDKLFTEFKKHGVLPNDLLKIEELDKHTLLKIKDISILYNEYQDKLSGSFFDDNDVLDILCSYIDKSDILKNASIYIDDFLGFTFQEYKLFEKIILNAKEVTVAICLDDANNIKPIENDMFYFNKKYANKLKKIADECHVSINEIYLKENYRSKNDELKFLEKNYNNNQKYTLKPNNINVFLAQNPYSEIEDVARKICDLVKLGYKYSEIGIVSENISAYAEDVKSIFKIYNIPVFVDEKKEINQNIIVKFVISILDVFAKNWSNEAVFELLKLELFDISKEDIFKLENYCNKWGIKNNKWFKEFSYENLNDNQSKLEDIRKRINSLLLGLKENYFVNKDVISITTGIYNFILENKIVEKLNLRLEEYNDVELIEEYITSYKWLIKVFESVCMLYGKEQISIERYKELLQSGFKAVELGKIPISQDEVILGDTERTRNHDLKVLFVVGVNDGSFPKVNRVEGFLNDDNRKVLKERGIELAKDSIETLYDEQFNIYRTLTFPSEKLFLSYSSSDKEGGSLRPSILIRKFKNSFVELKENSDIIFRDLNIYTKESAFQESISQYKKIIDGDFVNSEWKKIICYFYNRENRRFLDALEALKYTNSAHNLSSENISRLYGNTMKTSISKLEKYVQCPFSFYLTYGLKLKEKEELKLNFSDTGSFMHEVIDMFFSEVQDKNLSIKKLNNDEIENIVNKIIEELLKSTKYYTLSSSAKFVVLTQRLKKVILKSIEYIVYTIANSDFEVQGHEVSFENDKDYPPIKVNIDGKNIEIIGKIDRVDTAKILDKDYVRIIDYKSSFKDLDLNMVMSGLQIQLITYLDAISSNDDLAPSGILYLGMVDTIVKSAKNLTENEIEEEIRKSLKMKGVILADINVVKTMDKNLQSGYSDIIPAYVSKEGELSLTRSKVIDKEKFEKLIENVRNITKQILKEILKGKIEIKPYFYKNKTGCDYCKFKTICRFDTNFKENEYNFIKEYNE